MEKDLEKIYQRIKVLLLKHSPPFEIRSDKNKKKKQFDLWSNKDVVIAGRPRKEIFFASIIIQKNYVGFYFMPVYANPDLKKVFKPELLSLLKGKSCFHIKNLDANLENQIKYALKTGLQLYKKRGWV